MEDYTTKAKFELHPGAHVRLTKVQAAARMHRLAATGEEGVFEVRQTIEFKAGETIGLGALNKAQKAALADDAAAESAPGKGRKKAAPAAAAAV